ncbi:cell division control protein 6 homolog [Toxorhynchites rutilus septentrionalis]|uniref:cell division control protein 6 homolog n=1 Tax=Toxorhynchites rutilus septentrionalis TaxID=329112 RepID=UPI002478DE42|nr:cell division control protein 6 homolog [Toxorhynchites rutilus septentrionalis]
MSMTTRRSTRHRLCEVKLEEVDNTKENTTPTTRKGRPRKNEDIVEETESSPPKRSKIRSKKEPDALDVEDEISVSAVGSLPERERETGELAKYIEEILAENGSGSLYISGPPGTGKTATLTKIISDHKLASKIRMVYVNCTAISSAGGIYKKICEELQLKVGGTTEKMYLTAIEEYLKRKHKTIMLVLDEIDQLASSKQTVLYNIFEWPAKRGSRLILVGIANALDLTDRLLSRLQSRCELKPHLIHFLPYTKQQLVNILKSNLAENETGDLFNDAALQLLAAKVASTSGDARRALFLARRLVESTDNEYRQQKKISSKDPVLSDEGKTVSPPKSVQIRQVVTTLNQVYGSTQNMEDDEAFPLQQKILVCALLLLLKAGKSKDITVGRLHQVYKTVCAKRNLLSVDQTEFINICSLVETRGILRIQGKKEPRLNRVQLQWDEEEVHNILNDKQLIASVLSDTSCVGK